MSSIFGGTRANFPDSGLPRIQPSSRLYLPRIATTDANGSISFEFGHPDPGSVNTGSISIIGPKQVATFGVFINGVQVTQFAGQQQAEGVQQFPGDDLSVTATGLPPLTQYTAIYQGIIQDTNDPAVTFVAPSAGGSVSGVRPDYLLDSYTIVGGGGGHTTTKTYTLDAQARAVSFLIVPVSGPPVPVTSVLITGALSGYQYLFQTNPSQSPSRPALNPIQISPAIDPQVTIAVTCIAGGTAKVFIAEHFDPMVIGVETVFDAADVVTIKQTYLGTGNSGSISPTNTSVSVGVASTSVLAGFPPFLFFFLSNPLTNTSDIWVAYNVAAVVGSGIWLPPGAVLYEDLYMGPVNAITNGAGAESIGVTYA